MIDVQCVYKYVCWLVNYSHV